MRFDQATTQRGRLRQVLLVAALVIVGLAAAAPLAAQGAITPRVDALEARDAQLDEEIAEVTAELRRASEEYARLTAHVENVKTFGLETPLDVFDLQRTLREAQERADELQLLDTRIRRLTDERRQVREELHYALSQALDELRARRSRVSSDAEQAALDERIAVVTDRLQRYDLDLPEYAPVPIEEIVPDEIISSDELFAAAAELEDYAVRLERQLAQLEERLDAAERRQELARRTRELERERHLFDDGFGARLGSRRRSESTGDQAAGGGGSDGSENQDDGTADPSPVSDEPQPGTAPSEGGGASEGGADAPAPDMGGGGEAPPPGGEVGRGSDGDFVSDEPPADSVGGGSARDGVGGGSDDAPATETLRELRETSVLDVDVAASDDGEGRRRGSGVDGLRSRKERVEAELERIREERRRLLRAAEALDDEFRGADGSD